MVEILRYGLAAAPFVVAGVALLGFRWSAGRAGIAALAAALVAAGLAPGFGFEGMPEALLLGLGTAGEVLYVLGGGLLLYNVLSRSGAVDEVSGFLRWLEPDGAGLALLVVLGAGPFFESVTGFGVAVVICAPILLSAGFSPVRAAALASWGQLAVPWGALGVGTVIGADIAGLSFGRLSDISALLSLPLFPIYALAAVLMADGLGGLRRRGLEALLLSLVAGVGVLACSLYLAPGLSGVIGGLLAAGAFVLGRREALGGARVPVRALAPYAFLLALLILAELPVVEETISAAVAPGLAGAGTWLVASAAFAAVISRGSGSLRAAASGTLRQWLPVAVAILTFVLAGQVVAASGAAALLAGGAAAALGGYYPAFAPLVGALGGLLTGSNAGSNALFMPLQAEAAGSSSGPLALLAGLQNVAGSQANLLAPQRLALAASATGLQGKEAEIAWAVAPPVAASLALLVMVGTVVIVI